MLIQLRIGMSSCEIKPLLFRRWRVTIMSLACDYHVVMFRAVFTLILVTNLLVCPLRCAYCDAGAVMGAFRQHVHAVIREMSRPKDRIMFR